MTRYELAQTHAKALNETICDKLEEMFGNELTDDCLLAINVAMVSMTETWQKYINERWPTRDKLLEACMEQVESA